MQNVIHVLQNLKIGIYYILHFYYISRCYTGLLFLLDYLCYRPGTFDDWFTMKKYSH